MAYISCLAGIENSAVPMFSSILRGAGVSPLATIARLDVSELGKLAPNLLVCDVDGLETDRLELLRQIRFVLPECLIAVYTGVVKHAWGRECHLAGANCLLSKTSAQPVLANGIRDTLRIGCYTDPGFAAA
jgi:DNA-binding NarL/FixJ family response regulator